MAVLVVARLCAATLVVSVVELDLAEIEDTMDILLAEGERPFVPPRGLHGVLISGTEEVRSQRTWRRCHRGRRCGHSRDTRMDVGHME